MAEVTEISVTLLLNYVLECTESGSSKYVLPLMRTPEIEEQIGNTIYNVHEAPKNMENQLRSAEVKVLW